MPSLFAYYVLLLSLIVGGLIGVVGCQQPESPALQVYCAASFRPIMEQLAERFEEEQGVAVQLQFGGSNTLLSQIKLSRMGDVYLPAERWYIEQAQQQGLAGEAQTLGTMQAVLISNQPADASKTGTAKTCLADWLQDAPRVVMALPDVAAIGHVTKQTLTASGHWKSLDQRIVTNGVYKTTVTEVANDVMLGTADWGIVWNLVAMQHDNLSQSIPTELADVTATVAIAPLTTSQHLETAAAFADFVTNSKFAIAEWQAAGLERTAKLGERQLEEQQQ